MCDEAIAISGSNSRNNAEYRGFPVINGRKEVERLADLIEKKTKEHEEEVDIQLIIDGKEIGMVPFVQRTLQNVVIGAVKALDGYEEGKEIVIRIN